MTKELTTIFTLRSPENKISTVALDHFDEVETLDDSTREEYLKKVKSGLIETLKDHPELKSYKVSHVNNNILIRIPEIAYFPTFSEFVQMIKLNDTAFDSYMVLTQSYEKTLELIFKVPGYDAFPNDQFIRIDLITELSNQPTESEDNQEDDSVAEDSATTETETEESTDNADSTETAEIDPLTVEVIYKPFKSRTIMRGTVQDFMGEELNNATVLAVGDTILTRKVTGEVFKDAYIISNDYNIALNAFAVLPSSRRYINQVNAQIELWEKMAVPVSEFTNKDYPISISRSPERTMALSRHNLTLYIM